MIGIPHRVVPDVPVRAHLHVQFARSARAVLPALEQAQLPYG